MHLALGGQQDAPLPNTLFGGGILYNLEAGPDDFARLGVSIKGAPGQAPSKFVVRVVSAADGSGRLDGVVTNAPRVIYSASEIDKTTGQPALVDARQRHNTGRRGCSALADLPGVRRHEDLGCRSRPSAPDHRLAHHASRRAARQLRAERHRLLLYGAGSRRRVHLRGTQATEVSRATSSPTARPRIQPVGDGHEHRAFALACRPAPACGSLWSRPPRAARPALLRTAAVTLPQGLELGAQVGTRAGGLKLCTAAQFAKTDVAAATCRQDRPWAM